MEVEVSEGVLRYPLCVPRGRRSAGCLACEPVPDARGIPHFPIEVEEVRPARPVVHGPGLIEGCLVHSPHPFLTVRAVL